MPPVIIDVKNAADPHDCTHIAVEALAAGKVVAFPTETVYGLAVSALNEAAVQRLSMIKERGPESPFTLAVKSADDALDYVPGISPLGLRLARRCWPGPLTLVLEDNHTDSVLRRLPESVQASVSLNGTMGMRVPAHNLLLDAMRLTAGPLVLTSANRRGQPDATTAQEVADAMGDDVDLILDDGKSRYGQPSSIVRIQNNKMEILRHGVLGESMIERMADYVIVLVCTGNTCRSPMAESLLKKRLADRIGCDIDSLDEHGMTVMSAGISAVPGAAPSAESVEIMNERGLDLNLHESQPLTDRLVNHADQILTMTRGHREAIVTYWPTVANRVSMLSMSNEDVSDPIGCPLEVYRSCADQIDGFLAKFVAGLELEPKK